MSRSNQSEDSQESTDDVMKIMVATDAHLGYCEKDNVRGDDSFIAFEEILELAVENDVDFILLAGDLFHDATPSQNALQKCLKALRRNTLGDKPIMLEYLSDQSVNFLESLNQTVNYEDPNMNISIPVFSIHGNHDDPSGFGRLSSLDILSTTGLINYFGKWSDLHKIDISPIMLKKGETQLALYGLSHIHDARLARLFLDSKVVMGRPDEKTGPWFNIMVLHQNRSVRGAKNYLPEEILPDFLDVVIWGHEHDCRIQPEENFKGNFYVVQPGSSVATSLAEGESIQKHCGILLIHKKQFKLDPIPLKTVRPFIFDSINLIDYFEELKLNEENAAEKVTELAKRKVHDMMERAKEKLTGDPRQPKLPLIRLRITYTEEDQMFNAVRFGQQYNSQVANPMDMILFKRFVRKPKFEVRGLDKNALQSAFNSENVNAETRVEDVVDRYFEEVEPSKHLQVISSKSLSELCRRLVESNDDDAAENIIAFYKENANKFLFENLIDENNLEEALGQFREKSSQWHEGALKALDERGVKKNVSKVDFDNLVESDGEDTMAINSTTRGRKVSTRSRGRGRGRGSRGSRGVGTSRDELDISVNRQSQITESFTSQNSRRTRKAAQISYEISDSD